MYLEHFGLKQAPFHLTPDTEMFLGLAPHYEAIQTVLAALAMDEGVIKVSGEVGTGKTMVCRMLINQMGDDVQLVYLPNPALDGDELRQAIARELGLESGAVTVVGDIQERLLALNKQNKSVVLVVDEAQALSDEALEVLRLFGNLETEQSKLLQIVLFGQPELDERLAQHHLRQLRQRISYNVSLRALNFNEVVAYIDSRLTKAGGVSSIFNLAQKKAIWRASQGIPRLINQITSKAMVLACCQATMQVSNHQLYDAIHDTFDSCKPRFKSPRLWGWSNT